MSKPRHSASISSIRPRIGRSCLAAALSVLLAMVMVVMTSSGASAAQPPVNLGSAASFGVLAGTAVTNTDLTSITGDLGVSPGTSVTGFPPGTVSGATHAGDATASAAKSDLVAAYNDVAGRTPVVTVAAELGGTTRTPGVYTPTGGNFQITGTLTLDAQSDPDAVFIFRAATLTTANASNINLVNGAQANNVFWQLTDSGTLGTFCTFRGNVLATNSVAVSSGAAVFGRIFALNGTATLQGTSNPPKTRVTVPNDPPTTTTLTTSADPSRRGQSITLTATVSAVSGSVVPQGQVAFKDGATIIGSANQSGSGPAVLTISSLAAGQHPITAVYLGGDTPDGQAIIHFAPSTSAQVLQVVTSTLWDSTAVPAVASNPDTLPVVLGVKFKATANGTINGIRFYKGSPNTGTHVGSLWTSGGSLLASATFTGETASGWQQVNFATPVPITAGTTYIASYQTLTGHFSYTLQYFTSQYTNDPLLALADGAEDGNGVYNYSPANAFPSNTFQSTNYWVDVVFVPSKSLWDNSATPAVASNPDSRPVVVGVKFRATRNGTIDGIRFYKGSLNTGTHTGSLWTSGGSLLASATFTGETASGWQQVNFATPVPITAGTTYVASYQTTSGFFSSTSPYFTSQYTSGSLYALADGDEDGNGIYLYNATNTFPTSTHQSANYWVDVVFTTS
ncbi:DUF4082 domain-containing protein [Sphaerisporangium sp. NPDC088356]|uniref:DUF4082 domain-containing protein n=1 Tax=Sphaerisporangium sp. NPDC088356 TaxID=3154871 RepID=UPI0034459FFC